MLRIVQISDLHLMAEWKAGKLVPTMEVQNVISALRKDLKEYLKPLHAPEGLEPLLFFVGDAINQGGKLSSYSADEAFNCFDEYVLKPILKDYRELKGRIFITPGNHDVTANADKTVRDELLEATKSSKKYEDFDTLIMRYNPDNLDSNLIHWLTPYLKLEEKLYANYKHKSLTNLVSNFKTTVSRGKDLPPLKIGISCVNTAWLSQIRKPEISAIGEEIINPKTLPEKFILSQKVLKDAIAGIEDEDVDFRIFVTHYPIEGLLDLAQIRDGILNTYNLVLSGHTHRLRTTLENSAENKVETLFSGSDSALYKTQGDHQSGYKIIDYYEGKRYVVHHREYHKGQNEFAENNKLVSKDGIKTFNLKGGMLIEEPIDEVMKMTIERLANAKHMRVVGVGRQQAAKDHKMIRRYYTAMEDRLQSEEKFTLQRLTSVTIKDQFKKHLKNCFEHAHYYGTSMQLAFLNDWEIRFTFYTIDQDFLVVNVYQRENDEEWDCPYAYYSTNSATVAEFIHLFNDAWATKETSGEVITNLADFERFIPFNLGFISIQQRLGNLLHKIPEDSILSVSMEDAVAIMKSRIDDVEGNLINTHHKQEQRHNIFVNSLNTLSKIKDGGGSYRAVSFYEFWKSLEPDTMKGFIKSNQEAVRNPNCKIHRIYVVDRSRMEEDDYIEFHKRLFEGHMDISSPNYKFKILFLDDVEYESHLTSHTNFALWESEKEGALLNLYYNGKDKTRRELSVSQIRIFPKKGNKLLKESPDNLKDFKTYEETFEAVRTAQENQDYNKKDLHFLNKCDLGKRDIKKLRDRSA